MALIQCPECEGKVSDQAKACIHCGCPLDECSAKGNRLDGDCSYSVVMNSCGYDKIAVIKVVREFTGLGLKDARDLVEAAPALIAEGLSTTRAEELRCALEEGGADVAIVESSEAEAVAEEIQGEHGALAAERPRLAKANSAASENEAAGSERGGGSNVLAVVFAVSLALFLVGLLVGSSIGVPAGFVCIGSFLAFLVSARLNESEQEKVEREAERQRRREASDRSKYNGLKYTCPMCGSHKIKSIGTAKKLGGVAAVGLASQNIGKNYQCDDCNYRW